MIQINVSILYICVVEIPIVKSKSKEFHKLRVSFGKMLYRVHKAITKKSPPLEDLKLLICHYNSDLRAKLDDCEKLSSVIHLIVGESSLIDIELLQTVVKEFEVTEAEVHIEDYIKIKKDFCKSISLSLCLREKFAAIEANPFLQCETATYVFDWRPDERMLKDIIDIISESSGRLIKIKYIDTGFSIAVTCSFSFSLTGVIIAKVNENLQLLVSNDLKKLTIGYCTVWEREEVKKEVSFYYKSYI